MASMQFDLEAEIAERIKEINDEEVSAWMLSHLVTSFLSDYLFGAVLGSYGGGIIRAVYGDSCFGGSYEREDNVIVKDYLQRLIELACLNVFLRITRQKFYQQAGAGSQEAEYMIPSMFFEHAQLFAIKRQSEQVVDED